MKRRGEVEEEKDWLEAVHDKTLEAGRQKEDANMLERCDVTC